MGGVDDPRCPCCGSRLVVCPVCLAVTAVRPGRGRPRRFCSDRCRWRAGHVAARARARERRRARAGPLDEWLATLEPWPG